MTATERRLRICMLAGNPLLYDGRVLRHAQTLADAGHRVRLVGVMGPNDPAAAPPTLRGVTVTRVDRRRVGILPRARWLGSALRRRVAALGVQRLGARWPLPELWVAPCAVELLLAALADDADVFHANDLDTLVPAAWAAQLRGGRYVYDAHELYEDERPSLSGAERQARAHVERTLMAGAAASFTVSALLATEIARRHGVPPPIALHNVPALVPCPPRTRVTAFSAQRPLRLLLHGSWVGLDQPGVDAALVALGRVPQATLTLRGGVREDGALRRRIADLGLTDRVTLAPRLPGAEALVQAAIEGQYDIGLSVHLPDCESRRLATSSKVFEYLMAGLCIVAADQEGNRHILQDLARPDARQGADPDGPGSVGRLFRPGDVDSLAGTLHALSAAPDELFACQQAARRVAETSLCWERERERLLSVYRRL